VKRPEESEVVVDLPTPRLGDNYNPSIYGEIPLPSQLDK
jgi:hypothetical protein